MKRFPWIHAGKKTDPELPYEPPIPLGNLSNGEFFHEQTPFERKLKKEILRRSAENANRLGMDRRDFIASTMGMATTLSVMNLASGCSGDVSGKARSGAGDGGYDVPPDAMLDCDAADAALRGDEFILDMQTHHVEDEEHWRITHPGRTYNGDAVARALTFYGCADLMTNPIACVGPDRYVDAIFLQSDTTVAVLSGFPGPICEDTTLCDHPISNEDMVSSRDRVNAAAGTQRMVQHCQVMPNDQWPLQAAAMERINGEFGNHGWKVYPPYQGWWLDDPQIAYPFYEKAIELGQPIVCAHKGVQIGAFVEEYLDPKDVGPAAAAWPQISFVVYHSAVQFGAVEGPYDPARPTLELTGMDRLIRTVEENGLKDKNVYAEMGTAWILLMGSVEAAQHYVGKALKYLGEERLVWGSECTWFNSPQPQIEAFRTFTISKEFQDQYGYPELTPELKAKVFGLNAAKLYDIDATQKRCQVDKSKLALLRHGLDGELGARRWMFQPHFWRWKNFKGEGV